MEDKCANKSFKCDECAHHAQECYEYPCAECVHNGGEYDMYFSAGEMPKIITEEVKIMQTAIKDSDERRVFETGAVRDITEDKGRCDLLPLDVVCDLTGYGMFERINNFQCTGKYPALIEALMLFRDIRFDGSAETMFLEVSKHFANGAKKYAENNWRKGIPVKSYIDSAVRHYLKFKRGDEDEPHDLAFVWNLLCAVWTCKHKPELNDYAKTEEEKHD